MANLPSFSIHTDLIHICALICVIVWVGSLGLREVSGTEWGILRSLSGSGGKCVHIKGDSLANDAELELIQCSLGSPGQHFDVSGWGDYWEVGGALVFRSGRCITGDPRSPPTNSGWNTTAWDCLDQPHQSWKIGGSDLGAASPFQLVGSNAKCLTAEADGVYFDQYSCEGKDTAPHQWFIMERVPSIVALANVGIQNQCIHITDDSQSNGAALQLAPCAPTINQVYFAQELSQYVSTPGPLQFLSGKCLTGSATDPANGVNMTTSDCTGEPDQKWQIVGGVPFSSSFQLVGSNGKCITAEAGGLYIDQWDCGSLASTPHQWFTTLQLNRVGLLGSVAWDGLCVHIKGDSLAKYAGLEMIPCDPTSVAQQFDITDWGTYKSTAGILQFLSGRCITGDWSGTVNGMPTVLWDCEDQPHQKFLMRSGSMLETNSFQFEASNGLCLTPSPGDRGASFAQWECGDFATAPNQFFYVESRGVQSPAAMAQPPPPPPVPQCLVAHDTCNPDDVLCCDGYYCETFLGSSTCRAVSYYPYEPYLGVYIWVVPKSTKCRFVFCSAFPKIALAA